MEQPKRIMKCTVHSVVKVLLHECTQLVNSFASHAAAMDTIDESDDHLRGTCIRLIIINTFHAKSEWWPNIFSQNITPPLSGLRGKLSIVAPNQ